MSKRLIVSGLSEVHTTEVVRDAFSVFGQLLDVVVVREPETGRPHGYGLVVFADPDAAQAAIAGLDGKFIAGAPVSVREDAPAWLPGQPPR
jgi:cold-inducible RNA-binding protein